MIGFWAIATPVLFANCLSIMLACGIVSLIRMERKGLGDIVSRATYIAIFLPIFFLLGGLALAAGVQ